MIDTRASNRQERGGYAISAPLVLSQFFEDQKVRVAYEAAAASRPVQEPRAPVVAQAPQQPAFPSSAFEAAEPQPDEQPAEPSPQQQGPQQAFPQPQIFRQLPEAQNDFTVQTSWVTQRRDLSANVLHVRLSLHPSHDTIAQADDFQISVPSPNGGMQTLRARALTAGPGETYGPRKHLPLQAGQSITVTAHFVVPEDATLTADAGHDLEWVAVAQRAPALARDPYGFVLAQTTRGVLVRQVAPNSIAQRAGLQPGDIIVTINGQHVTDAGQAREMIAGSPEGQLAVSVRRSNAMPRPVMATSTQNQ
jgi:hypothetical protein